MDFGKWLILGAAIGLSAAASVSGFVFTVNSTGDGSDLSPGDHVCQAAGGQCTLRAAIEEANTNADSDSIHFAIPTSDPGYNSSTGGWTINVPSALPDLTHDLDITGPGASKLIVRRSAAGSYRIFNVTTPVSVSLVGITISNGHSATGSGSGINNSGIATINITNCILSGHSSDIYGGAIDNPGVGTVNVNRCTISNNQAGAGGGGIRNGPTGGVTISNSTLSNNLAGGDMSGSSGGGVYNRGFMEITNSFFTDNTCSNYDPGDGGGGITNGGAVNITNSTFTRNSALNLLCRMSSVAGACGKV